MKFQNYSWLLFQVIAWFFFLLAMSWSNCIPIEEAPSYFDNVPSLAEMTRNTTASCFTLSKGSVWLFDFPPWRENYIWFGLILFFAVLFQFLTVKPFLKWKKSRKNK